MMTLKCALNDAKRSTCFERCLGLKRAVDNTGIASSDLFRIEE